MAQKSPIIFSNECDRHYDTRDGKTEGKHECVNFIDSVHNSQQNHRSEFIVFGEVFSLSLLITATRASIFQVIS